MLGTIFLYNFILLGSTAFIYLSEKANAPLGRKFCTIIAFFIVFLPASFRYYIGVDYHSYSKIYEVIGKGESLRIEPAYYFLNVLLNWFELDVEWLFAVMAFFTYFIAFLSYPRKHKALFHYLYLTTFYFVTFISLRSMIVASLVMLAISVYINNQKIILYFILILVASLFHKSAILFIIFPFLDTRLTYSFMRRASLVILMFLVAALYYRFELVGLIFKSPIAVSLGYDSYLESFFHIRETAVNTGIGVFLRLLPFVILCLFLKKIVRNNKKYIIWILICLCCIVASFLALTIEIFARLERIFALAYIFAPMLILYTKTIPYRVWMVLMICLINLALYNNNYLRYTTQTCEGGRLSPYVSIFNKADDESLKLTTVECMSR